MLVICVVLENNEAEKTSLCATSNILLNHLFRIIMQICVICLILRVRDFFVWVPRNEARISE